MIEAAKRNPCKRNCRERSATCHGECEKYKEWREWLDGVNKEIQMENERYQITDAHKKWMHKKMRMDKRRKSTAKF